MRAPKPLVIFVALLAAIDVHADSAPLSVDRFVPHVSTVPANEGERVGLFLHERLSAKTANRLDAGHSAEGHVVLLVHGISVPSIPDFDLDFEDYSWMAYLAASGFDTFAMDFTGYGRSPRPKMHDPCNMSSQDRSIIGVENSHCTPSYGYRLTSSQSDWDEIDTVVDFIRALRGVDRVSLVGWSLGGMRAGGYAAQHPEKIDKLILYAPFYLRTIPSHRPDVYPVPGPTFTLQKRETLLQARWGANVACEHQVEPGVMEAVWQSIMSFDSYGSAWLPGEGIMRVPNATYWGWNRELAARIAAPTLILVGNEDALLSAANALYADMTGTENKVLVQMQCATHFAIWEASQYQFMHKASSEWLSTGRYSKQTQGKYDVRSKTR